jgi:hypothetical protein
VSEFVRKGTEEPRKNKLDMRRANPYIHIDYVTDVNASSAGLKKPMGLILRWDTVLRDLQIQLEPRVSQSEAALLKAPHEDGSRFSTRNWI